MAKLLRVLSKLTISTRSQASRSHPDPTGEQLRRLVPLLKAIVAECDKTGPHFSWGILWDFMSLPQRGRTTGFVEDVRDAEGEMIQSNDDRTPAQLERFIHGLGKINVWYGAQYTHTLVLNTPMPDGAENAAPYERRGWRASMLPPRLSGRV